MIYFINNFLYLNFLFIILFNVFLNIYLPVIEIKFYFIFLKKLF